MPQLTVLFHSSCGWKVKTARIGVLKRWYNCPSRTVLGCYCHSHTFVECCLLTSSLLLRCLHQLTETKGADRQVKMKLGMAFCSLMELVGISKRISDGKPFIAVVLQF
eukprot:TRINITY_DN1970_c0_g3_i1.p1 TRINITY_DN1970_c0_g3~~TRINITY_DN1970_c0_g3_i1.p1  ORF type:complete len:108 (-),score=6.99 TRINITY_DN1970_c0_g3_i1:110-433(-)